VSKVGLPSLAHPQVSFGHSGALLRPAHPLLLRAVVMESFAVVGTGLVLRDVHDGRQTAAAAVELRWGLGFGVPQGVQCPDE
jgi:hypothetical protein